MGTLFILALWRERVLTEMGLGVVRIGNDEIVRDLSPALRGLSLLGAALAIRGGGEDQRTIVK